MAVAVGKAAGRHTLSRRRPRKRRSNAGSASRSATVYGSHGLRYCTSYGMLWLSQKCGS